MTIELLASIVVFAAVMALLVVAAVPRESVPRFSWPAGRAVPVLQGRQSRSH